jgi:3-oxoacyl-[acyl-carrier protein] reductase
MILDRKDILVTGASGVIGHAIARRLAASGFRVHLAGRDRRRLASVQKDLSACGWISPVYIFRLSDLASSEKAVMTFVHRAKNPYGLVCNAGNLGPVGPFWELPLRAWRKSVQENFLSHASMIHAFVRAMAGRKRHAGAIAVLSGAGVGHAGDFSEMTSYSTSKAALVHLVEALAAEFKTIGITINAVAPGAVLSGMTEQARRAGKKDPHKFVSPDLAAQLIEFLMSPASRSISGRLLSARFDQTITRQKGKAIEHDPHWFRLRRIDYDLFSPRRPL